MYNSMRVDSPKRNSFHMKNFANIWDIGVSRSIFCVSQTRIIWISFCVEYNFGMLSTNWIECVDGSQIEAMIKQETEERKKMNRKKYNFVFRSNSSEKTKIRTLNHRIHNFRCHNACRSLSCHATPQTDSRRKKKFGRTSNESKINVYKMRVNRNDVNFVFCY